MKLSKYLVIFLAAILAVACSKKEEPKKEIPEEKIDYNAPPKSIEEINTDFKNIKIVDENGQKIMYIDVYADSPDHILPSSVSMDLCFFIDGLREHFKEVNPDILRVDYYGYQGEHGKIYSFDLPMNKVIPLEKEFFDKNFSMLTYIINLKKHNIKIANQQIKQYCDNENRLEDDKQFCKKQRKLM